MRDDRVGSEVEAVEINKEGEGTAFDSGLRGTRSEVRENGSVGGERRGRTGEAREGERCVFLCGRHGAAVESCGGRKEARSRLRGTTAQSFNRRNGAVSVRSCK